MKIRFSTQVKTGSFDLGLHKPVRVASIANIDLTTGGLLTIDGVTLVADDRVLVKNQTVGSENGIYSAETTAWIRTDDFDESGEIISGSIIAVQEGTVNADTLFVLSTDGTIILGTTSLSFVKTTVNPSDVLFKSNWIPNEIPSGAINGTNVTFTLANTPDIIVSVTINGIDQLDPDDYSITGSTITLVDAPKGSPGNPDKLLASYFKV